jgi:hypothetical protein
MDALVGAGGVVIGALLGFLGSVLTAERTNRAAAKREADGRAEIRKQQRDDFQRQMLLDLQGAMTRYIRSVGRIYVHDTNTYKQHQKFFQLGAELNQESFVAQVELQHLQERVKDDELRESIEKMINIGVEFTVPTSIQKVEDSMTHFHDVVTATNERLGEILRSYL